MKRALARRAFPALAVLASVASVLLPAPASAQQVENARLERRSASDPATVLGVGDHGSGWFAWTRPATSEGARTCCFRRGWKERGCSLEGRDHGWGTSSDWPTVGLAPELVVLVRLERGRPTELRAVGASCPIDGGGRGLVVIEGVAAEPSLDLLERWARDPRIDEDVRDSALAAIGFDADADGARRLERLALEGGLDREVRRQALFWAGQTLGPAVVPIVDRFLASVDDEEMRSHAYFVLAEADSPEALARLRRAAREDRDAESRSQALFWLAQTGAPGAAEWILEAITADPDPDVRGQAVFALSELDDGFVHLSRLLRESPHAEVRRQALFWLAQSDDPRALAEVERILER